MPSLKPKETVKLVLNGGRQAVGCAKLYMVGIQSQRLRFGSRVDRLVALKSTVPKLDSSQAIVQRINVCGDTLRFTMSSDYSSETRTRNISYTWEELHWSAAPCRIPRRLLGRMADCWWR